MAGGAHVLDELDAVHDRHVDIGDHHIDALGLEHVEPLLAVFGLQHLEARIGERMVQHGQDGAGIVHRQYAQGHPFMIAAKTRRRVQDVPAARLPAIMAALGVAPPNSKWLRRAVSAALTSMQQCIGRHALDSSAASTFTAP
jgi:hypothetical protein